MGVGIQVLSPMPELLSYWFELDDALVFGRYVNEQIGAMVDQAPERFMGLGMIPLQDPERAAVELERLMEDTRFRGVELGTNVNGLSIADPRFDPVFAAAEETGAAVFIHAFHPQDVTHLIGPPILKAVAAFPCETALTISALIASGVLSKYPKLRVAFSHGGGAFGLVLPRLVHGWKVLPALQEAVGESPREIATRIYYDSLVYDEEVLKFLVSSFGEHQILVGTDFPFQIYERDPLGAVNKAGFSGQITRSICEENARTFLNLN